MISTHILDVEEGFPAAGIKVGLYRGKELISLQETDEDGRIADATQPQLMATDLGATRGDGVFESLLAVEGRPRKLQAHYWAVFLSNLDAALNGRGSIDIEQVTKPIYTARLRNWNQ